MTEKSKEFMTIPGKWEIDYTYAAGAHATKFFRELKENKRIFGVSCKSCRRVLMPPRPLCERCYISTGEWVEVSDTGVIETFGIVYWKFKGLPDPPYAVGVIKLGRADEGILHFIGGVDLSDPKKATDKIRVGSKVRAVWADERKGTILDIKYFEPIG